MDDFDGEYYDDEEQQSQQAERESKSLKDRKEQYDKAKEKYEKGKQKVDDYKNKKNLNSQQKEGLNNLKNNLGQNTASSAGKKATEEGAKKAGQAAAKEGAKEVGKKAAKEGAKEVGKEAGKAVAKQAGKEAVKTGAKVAAEGAATATGVGAPIAAAIEVADRLNEARKKAEAKLKEKTGIDLKEERKKTRIMLILVVVGLIMAILILPLLLVYGSLDTGVGDLETLVKERETEYTVDLIRFSDGELSDLLRKDIDLVSQNNKKSYCYKTILKEGYSGELNGYLMGSSSETETEDEYEVSAKNVEKMLKSESDNFNKIEKDKGWTEVTKFNIYENTSTIYEIKDGVATGNDTKLKVSANPSGGVRTTITNMEKAKHRDRNNKEVNTRLNIPDLSKYDIDPGNNDKVSKSNVYVDMISPYVQKWIVPYSILINTQDDKFVTDKLIEKMYSNIKVELYQINRDTKTTSTQYYLQCEQYYSWKEDIEEKIDTVYYYIDVDDLLNKIKKVENIDLTSLTKDELKTRIKGNEFDLYGNGSKIITINDVLNNAEYKKACRTYDDFNKTNVISTANVTNSEVLGTNTNSKKKTNTRDFPTLAYKLGPLPVSGGIAPKTLSNIKETKKSTFYNPDKTYGTPKGRWEYQQDITKTQTKKFSDVKEYRNLIKDSNGKVIIAKDANGNDMIKDKTIKRDIKTYKYIPKFTYIEDMYRIISASYSVVPVDETFPPLSKTVSELKWFDWNFDTATIDIVEYWDEDFTAVSSEEKKYKVSYVKEEDYQNYGRDISRIEWIQDWGDYNNKDPERQFNEIYPKKDNDQKKEAYDTYAGNGYSYDDLNFAFEKIEEYYGNRNYSSVMGTVDLSNIPADGFAWPVEITSDNPNVKKVNCIFGYTPKYGRDHRGIDISRGNVKYTEGALTKGPRIVAAHDGTVTARSFTPTADSNSYTYINITTPDGNYTTQYGHLSEIYVQNGQNVKRGEIIGRMGTTGESTGVHLHYVIKDASGNLVDPLNYYITNPPYGSIDRNSITYFEPYEYVGSKSAGLSNSGIETGSAINTTTYQAAAKYTDLARKWGGYYGVDPGLIIAMIAQESGGNPASKNNYSIGLMQWEYSSNGTSITTTKADGTAETINNITVGTLANDPDFQIRVGTAEFKSKLSEFNNNQLVALQGYNYGSSGIKRCITYHLSAGANSDQRFCGISDEDYKKYIASQDTAWLSAREWYTSTGHSYFGVGGGDKQYVEHILRYYKQI